MISHCFWLDCGILMMISSPSISSCFMFFLLTLVFDTFADHCERLGILSTILGWKEPYLSCWSCSWSVQGRRRKLLLGDQRLYFPQMFYILMLTVDAKMLFSGTSTRSESTCKNTGLAPLSQDDLAPMSLWRWPRSTLAWGFCFYTDALIRLQVSA